MASSTMSPPAGSALCATAHAQPYDPDIADRVLCAHVPACVCYTLPAGGTVVCRPSSFLPPVVSAWCPVPRLVFDVHTLITSLHAVGCYYF